jgi:hypothetical protein
MTEFDQNSRAAFIARKYLKKRTVATPNDRNPPTEPVEEPIFKEWLRCPMISNSMAASGCRLLAVLFKAVGHRSPRLRKSIVIHD